MLHVRRLEPARQRQDRLRAPSRPPSPPPFPHRHHHQLARRPDPHHPPRRLPPPPPPLLSADCLPPARVRWWARRRPPPLVALQQGPPPERGHLPAQFRPWQPWPLHPAPEALARRPPPPAGHPARRGAHDHRGTARDFVAPRIDRPPKAPHSPEPPRADVSRLIEGVMVLPSRQSPPARRAGVPRSRPRAAMRSQCCRACRCRAAFPLRVS